MAMGLEGRLNEAIEGAKNPDGTKKTRAQIARECDVTPAAVTHWLNGATQSLKAESALKLEQATGYRAFWILYGRGTKKSSEPMLYWPFNKVPIERFTALDQADQGYVQREMLKAIQECEGSPSLAVTVTAQEHSEFERLQQQVGSSKRKRKQRAA